jgi:membrane protease YdiL (CAAX protease family)
MDKASLWPVLRVALLTTAAVTLVARVLPESWAATAVSACFFAICYLLVLRRDPATVAGFGMRLGGLFEPTPLRPLPMLRETLRALGWAGLLGVLCFPLFWVGYVLWWSPQRPFSSTIHVGIFEEILGQLVVIALPEEMFYRGYLQTALDRVRPPRWRLLGADIGWGVVWSSTIFALGHLATQLDPGRLSVFFPSLVFGWLRARTRGIGASVFFHALCNLFAAYLARSYGLLP